METCGCHRNLGGLRLSIAKKTVRAPFNQVVQVAGMPCSAERSEERTNAMVRAPVKGARMRSETSESSRSQERLVPRISEIIKLSAF
jgi:hypothetical protein